MYLKIKKDVIKKRLRKLRKEKDYTISALADEIGYSEQTIKGWLSNNNEKIPGVEALILLSELFDVDVQYLIGEQPCKRVSVEYASNILGLDYDSVDVLRKNRLAGTVISDLLKTDSFPEFIISMSDYSHSHHLTVTVEDETGWFQGNVPEITKASLKAKSLDTFSKVLDELYSNNTDMLNLGKDLRILNKVYNKINSYHDNIKKGTVSAELKEWIASMLNMLAGYQTLKKFDIDCLINNYEEIFLQIGIPDTSKGDD